MVRIILILPLGLLILAKVTSKDLLQMGSYTGYGPLSKQPIWLQAVQIYVLVDFISYWTHRLFIVVAGGPSMRCITALRNSTGWPACGCIR